MPIEKEIRKTNNGALQSNVNVYKKKEIIGSSAIKKGKIVDDTITEEDQLNLIASLIEEYLNSIGYQSDLFTYSKNEFAKIKAVLNG